MLQTNYFKNIYKLLLKGKYALFVLVTFYLICCSQTTNGQLVSNDNQSINYSLPKEYEIGGIVVKGTDHLDKSAIRVLSGLSIGDRIQVPGEEIANAIDILWSQGLFSDIKIYAERIEGNIIFLEIYVQDLPRLSKFSFEGIKKNDIDELREKLNLIKGKVVNDNLKLTAQQTIVDYYIDKGFKNTTVVIEENADTSAKAKNEVVLTLNIEKGNKIKVNEIVIVGNTSALSKGKIKRSMKNTKENSLINLFSASKYIENDYETDKATIITKYNTLGYRDAKIKSDTVYSYSEKAVNIIIYIHEGNQYHIRNISWVGNAKYTDSLLTQAIGITKGEVYNQSLLDQRLYMDPAGGDISSLYLDDGYLFFNVAPIETFAENDSVDIEMRIYEGPQATINNIIVRGNDRTHDHVILREIRTKPGDLFNRSDVIRSQRELANLGYFDPEQLQVNPSPNPTDGTVDIEYVIAEKPSDQLELSVGYGGQRLVGTLGVTFNNFSLKNVPNPKAWTPLPAGDGQRLSLRWQSYGFDAANSAQSMNFSFTEPWLGGKKPNMLTVSTYYNVRRLGTSVDADDYGTFNIIGSQVGWGIRLPWPDDFFQLFNDFSYQKYILKNYNDSYTSFPFSTGSSNIISFKTTLIRSSISDPLFPIRGSKFSLSLQLTPPYSIFKEKVLGENIDYDEMTIDEKYKWIEYHKWKFDASWFTALWKPKSASERTALVLNLRYNLGILGTYNPSLGTSPFERFFVGGADMLAMYNYTGELIDLRGYSQRSLSPTDGSTMYNTFTAELRYPISLNPQATIYAKGFVEGGNAWSEYKLFNPFSMKRSAGIGVNLFMPMFGMIELNYGYGFDQFAAPANGLIEGGIWKLHFRIGGQ